MNRGLVVALILAIIVCAGSKPRAPQGERAHQAASKANANQKPTDALTAPVAAKPSDGNQGQGQKIAPNNKPTLVEVSPSPFPIKSDKDGWDKALVILTGLLVFVAAFQILYLAKTITALNGQAQIMQKQTNYVKEQSIIMEKQVVLTQRPRIVVRNFYFSNPKGVGGIVFVSSYSASGQFYAVNCGGTSAQVRDSDCEVFVTKGPLPQVPFYEGNSSPIKPFTIAPGQSYSVLFGMKSPIDKNKADELARTGARVYVVGRIGYVDDLSIYRTTAFCRLYDPTKDRFIPVDNPDYEHSD